jgi:hypothetical protein
VPFTLRMVRGLNSLVTKDLMSSGSLSVAGASARKHRQADEVLTSFPFYFC